MQKTTVYLSKEMKQALERLAAVSGRSEADLIRDAIATQLRSVPPPRPRGQLFCSGDPTLSENADEALAGFGER